MHVGADNLVRPPLMGHFMRDDGKPMRFWEAVIGGRSVGAPGTLALMAEMHKRHGKLGEKYFLVPCNRIDSINRELTVPTLTPPLRYRSVGGSGARLVLDQEKIGNRHIWVESFVLNELFLSDALMDALTEIGCTGWENGVPEWRERWSLELDP